MTPLDTSQAATDIQLHILTKTSGIERLRIAIDLSELARTLTFARIENEHPGLSGPLLIRYFDLDDALRELKRRGNSTLSI